MIESDKSPSEAEKRGKEWLLCGLERSSDRLDKYLEKNDVTDPDEMEKKELDDYDNPKVKDIDERALNDEYLSGKWELSALPEDVDTIWNEIKRLVENEKVWGAQVTTNWIREKRDRDVHRIRVYTPNYLDEDDVLRVGELIKSKCDLDENICYKPDIYNILKVYSDEGEDMKLPKETRYEL